MRIGRKDGEMELRRDYVESFTGQIMPKTCKLLFQEENLIKQLRDENIKLKGRYQMMKCDLEEARDSLSSKDNIIQSMNQKINTIDQKLNEKDKVFTKIRLPVIILVLLLGITAYFTLNYYMLTEENNSKRLMEKEDLIKDLREQLRTLNHQINEKDKVIVDLNYKEKKKKQNNRENMNKEEKIEEKKELQKQIEDLKNQRQKLNHQINEKDKIISELKENEKNKKEELKIQLEELIRENNLLLLNIKYKSKYRDEEIEKRNKMIFSNQLLQNQNLETRFVLFGSDPDQLMTPNFIAYNDKLNLICVADYNNNRVQITDKNGSLIRSFHFDTPFGIEIIPSLHLLAVSSFNNHVIDIFDLSPLLSHHNKDDYEDHIYESLPLLYTIGEGYGRVLDDHFRFQCPMGIAYSEGKGILVISDYGNKRIEMYKIKRYGYEHHSFIPSLPFYPVHIAISSPGDLILISGLYNEDTPSNKNRLKIYKEKEGKWSSEGKIKLPPSSLPAYPMGVAIHSPLYYFVIADRDNNRILFFNLKTHELICSFQPTLPLNSSSYFQKPSGIRVDEEADLIAVTDIGTGAITLFQSPILL